MFAEPLLLGSIVAAVGVLFVVAAASYAGTTLALRRHFDENAPRDSDRTG